MEGNRCRHLGDTAAGLGVGYAARVGGTVRHDTTEVLLAGGGGVADSC